MVQWVKNLTAGVHIAEASVTTVAWIQSLAWELPFFFFSNLVECVLFNLRHYDFIIKVGLFWK